MSIGQNAVGAAFGVVSKTATFQLGTRMKGAGGSEWIYVQAGGAITGLGYVLTVNRFFDANMVSTSNDSGGAILAVAPAAFAEDEYGWAQIYGACSLRVGASAAANVRLNTTGTGGQLDDDGTSSTYAATGLILTTAREASAGLAPGFLNYPSLGLAAI